ncbi:MAG: 5'-3' exonuclease H3TH domain-containing protein [Microgenomates group bacterium]
MERKILVLIDGNSLLHRAYHAYPRLTTPAGELVGAVYGFTTMLLTALEKLAPQYVAIAWDVGKVTFRTAEYALYKAGRPETEQELIDQIERTKEIVTALNIPQFGVDNYEADDVIGTLSRQAIEGAGKVQVIIVTGDRDALQLIDDDKIVVYMPSGGGASSRYIKDRGVSLFDEEAVKAKYGLSPKQVTDLKGLMGDPSDNIKGVPGVGQVTATKLLQEAGSVEKVYEDVGKLSVTERIKNLLKEGRESAFLSKKIATIDRDIPIKLSWEECELSNYDREKVLAIFEELRFKSLINKLPKDKWEEDLEHVFG